MYRRIDNIDERRTDFFAHQELIVIWIYVISISFNLHIIYACFTIILAKRARLSDIHNLCAKIGMQIVYHTD